MPIYDFICSGCSTQFDKLVPFDWKSQGITCPECSSVDLEKAVPLVGFSSGGKMISSAGNGGCSSCSSGCCGTCH